MNKIISALAAALAFAGAASAQTPGGAPMAPGIAAVAACNPNQIALLGDSRLAYEYNPGNYKVKQNVNFLPAAGWLSGQRFTTEGTNFGIGGLTSAQYLNRNVAGATSVSISGTTLTVGGTITGTWGPGQQVTAPGVAPGTFINAGGGTGTGGAGTYTVTISQTVGAEAMTATGVANNAFASSACWLMIGAIYNDLNVVGTIPDPWLTNIKPVVQQWIARGPNYRVLLLTETGGPNIGTASNTGAVMRYNRQLRQFATTNPQAVMVDYAAVVMDPTSSGMAWKSGYSSDSTHCNTMTCALAAGQVLASVLTQQMPALPSLPNSQSEGYFDQPVAATCSACSISGTTLTVGGTVTGTWAPGQVINGTGVTSNTWITAGGGTSFTINNSQTVASEAMTGTVQVSYSYDPMFQTNGSLSSVTGLTLSGTGPSYASFGITSGFTAALTSSITAGAYGNDWTFYTTSSGNSSANWAINVTWNMGSFGAEIVPGLGEQFYAAVELDLPSVSTNFLGCALYLEAGAGGANATTADAYPNNPSGTYWPATAYTGLDLRTEAISIPAGSFSDFDVQLQCWFYGNGSVGNSSNLVHVRRLGVYKKMPS